MLKQELMSSFLVVCFILTGVPVALCISSPPVIYIAGDGSGDYNCAGKSDQVQINQALQFVANNNGYTTVHLKGPFTYVIDDTIQIGDNTILEGDSTAVIKLADHAGWPTMKPLIQQMSDSGNDNITVRGFEVNGNYAGNSEITLGRGYYNIMYFVDSDNIKVYNMYMHDGMGDGLRINQGKNIQFYNNTIYKLGHDGLFAIKSENVEGWNNRITCRTNSALRAWNSNDVKFHDNEIDSFYHWSAGGPGIQIEKSEDIIMDNIEIYNNVIHDTYGPGIWIVTHDTTFSTEGQAKNIHIHHNIFYNTGTNPNIDWVGGIIASGFHDTLIENNAFDGCYGAAIAHMFSADYSPKRGFKTIVRNNVIVNTQKRTKDPDGTGCGIANYLPDTHFFVMDNDCLYNNLGGDYKNCLTTTDVYVNPLFAEQKIHDYHLQSTAGRWDGKTWTKDNVSSLCIDAGYPYSDYFDEPEPNGKRINIGPDGNTIYASKSESAPTSAFPTANFNSNVTSGIVPLTVKFTDLSKNATTWKWDFGDGTNSTQQNPIHVYSVEGIYKVTLTVNNLNGMNYKTGDISVVKDVNSSYLLPIYNNRLREASPENVYSSSSFLDVGGMNGVGRYRDILWFDLGGYASTTQINKATLSFIWYYPNSPRLNDTVIEIYRPASTWNSGYVSWNKKDNNLAWSNPGGDWYDKDGILQGSVPYTTLTLTASSLPSNSYCEFDVTDLVREYTRGKYPNTGFHIKARSESDNYIAFYTANCKLRFSTSILPTANFGSSVNGGYAPLFVQFTDSSENTTSRIWNFGDGNFSTEKNPVHTYSRAGYYTVNLTVSNANGTNSKTAIITVLTQSVLPEADFSTNVSSGTVPLSVLFTDHSKNATQWNWNFGDGVSSTQQNPMHIYSAAGNYTVNLTASNPHGTNSKLAVINVLAQPVLPVADFSSNVTQGYAPLTVRFTDLSKNATQWMWDFGDGTNSIQQNPMHTYVTAGSYNVILLVSNEHGKSSKNVAINVLEESKPSGGNDKGGSSMDENDNGMNSSGVSTSGESSNGDSSSGSSSSGSGGGGTGGSPEPQSNVEIKELSQTFIASGQPVKFDFPQQATAVASISFDSKKTAGKTTTIVEILKEKSTLVSGMPSDEVYEFLNIWVGNGGYATSDNLENAVVCFKVEESWIQDKKIDRSSITLNRYNDGKWNPLPTNVSGEDDMYLYFTAQTTGFSPFAITGKVIAKEIDTETRIDPDRPDLGQNGTGTNIENTSEQIKSSKTSGEGSKKTPGFEAIGGIVSLLAVFLRRWCFNGKSRL